MFNKKSVKNKRFDIFTFVLVIALIISGFVIFKKPIVTGKAILGKETVYSENLNIQKNESGTYNWTLKSSGNIKSLKVTGSVSSNGSARVYVEKGGKRLLLFDSSKQLFDVAIHVLPEYKKILRGDKILIQNVLFNLRGFGAGNVNVKYSIKNSKGDLLAIQEETVFVETQAKFVRELVIPDEIKPGIYLAFVEASANGTIVGSGSDTFEVKAKYEVPYYQQLRFYLVSSAIVVALVIAFIFGIYGFNVLKKKKEIEKIKKLEPMERIEKFEKELKSIEEAYKSGFLSEETYQKEKKRIEEKLGVSKK